MNYHRYWCRYKIGEISGVKQQFTAPALLAALRVELLWKRNSSQVKVLAGRAEEH